jgi:hypothetical protein
MIRMKRWLLLSCILITSKRKGKTRPTTACTRLPTARFIKVVLLARQRVKPGVIRNCFQVLESGTPVERRLALAV